MWQMQDKLHLTKLLHPQCLSHTFSAWFGSDTLERTLLHDACVSGIKIFTCSTNTPSQTNPLTSSQKFTASNQIPHNAKTTAGPEKAGAGQGRAGLICFSVWILRLHGWQLSPPRSFFFFANY